MAKTPDGRPAKDVVDDAVREGEKWERTCFVLIVAAGVCTAAALIYGAIRGDSGLALGGGLGGSFAFASLIAYANNVRRDKTRTRLLEVALAKAATAEEVVKVLRDVFDRPGLFGRKSP